MSVHDPIGDMLTIVRNGSRAGHAHVNVKRSNINVAIVKILKSEGYIQEYKTIEDDKQGKIRVYLHQQHGKKESGARNITKIERVSRPGLRVYASQQEIPKILNGLGVCVMSTSKGVMTGLDAKKNQVGGEVLLKVW